MPAIKTESKAVNALVSSIEDTSLMVPYIDQNDKTPIWDGFIYLYSNPCLTKDFFAGRAPVQVKGHEENDLSQSQVTHDAKVVDLNAYLQDGGVIYFLIYVAADRRASRIYYTALTAEKLRGLLNECKPNQEKKRILLDTFPEDEAEKIRIIREFIDQYRPVYRPPQPKPQEDIAFKKLPFLKEFTCQRLTADPKNFDKIQDFRTSHNLGLSLYLRHLAWEEDSNGECAFYLVKDSAQNILFFFSVKGGSLHSSDESLPGCGGVSFYAKDQYAAAELVHICSEDRAKDIWKTLTAPYPYKLSIGETIFWSFVVPAIAQLQNVVGLSYLYMFVPDVSPDGRLLQYYHHKLHFDISESLNTVATPYSTGCPMVYQKISELMKHRQEFFESIQLESDVL